MQVKPSLQFSITPMLLPRDKPYYQTCNPNGLEAEGPGAYWDKVLKSFIERGF